MKLSVIVCTRNRAYALPECLDSIAASLGRAVPLDAEIVVLDNASDDDTSAVATGWAKTSAFPVTIGFEAKKGLAAARNAALRIARGEWIIFTDDDCRLAPDYIKNAMTHAARDQEPVVRGGQILLGDSTDLPLTIKTDTEPNRWQRGKAGALHEVIGGKSISGCNMMLPRVLIDRLGAFDERLGAGTKIPGGEDTDYYMRAYLAGYAIEYAPDMSLFHWHGRKQMSDGYKLMQNYMLSTGALYIKYLLAEPRVCRELYWDARKMVEELFAGRNLYWPEIGFSYADRVGFSLRGIWRFMVAPAFRQAKA